MKNNLFYYATSELSQDAFLCYLLSFAKKEFAARDPQLSACVRNFLRKCLPGIQDSLNVTDIQKQYEHIDVLVTVNDKYKIIIEDKTFTGQHGNQIQRYKDCLLQKGCADIYCVYYKIVAQCCDEPNVINLNRSDMLEALVNYHGTNSVICDYVGYLKYIDADENAYKTCRIEKWRDLYNHVYKGFFAHLVKDSIVHTDSAWYGWGYVNNPSGGFWGLWWHPLSDEAFASNNIPFDVVDEIYLQIEDDTICIKLTMCENCPKEKQSEKAAVAQWLRERFLQEVPELEKRRMRSGNHMTAGYIRYNEKNYAERILLMEQAMDEISKGNVPYPKRR